MKFPSFLSELCRCGVTFIAKLRNQLARFRKDLMRNAEVNNFSDFLLVEGPEVPSSVSYGRQTLVSTTLNTLCLQSLAVASHESLFKLATITRHIRSTHRNLVWPRRQADRIVFDFLHSPYRAGKINFLLPKSTECVLQGDSPATSVKEMPPGTPWPGTGFSIASPNLMALDFRKCWNPLKN